MWVAVRSSTGNDNNIFRKQTYIQAIYLYRDMYCILGSNLWRIYIKKINPVLFRRLGSRRITFFCKQI